LRLPAALFAALLVALLAGCGSRAPHLSSGDVPVGGVPLTPEHTLTAGDEFEIRFPFAPEFNDRVDVGQDGMVSPKLIGPVIVGGLTVPEATARLREAYAKKIKNPEPSLTVRAYAAEVFWVEGEVTRPGLIRSNVPITATRAIAQAGGITLGAKTSEILVIRRDPSGAVRAYKNAVNHRPAGNADEDPFLKSFDVVYVSQTPIGSLHEFLVNYVQYLPFKAFVAPVPVLVPSVATPFIVPR
jgi:protein involved in polysaccharide export with SLBB domain